VTTAQELAWQRCDGCRTLHYVKKLSRCLGVCPECGHHHRLTAAERVGQLVDDGTFVPAATVARSTDVLGFPGYRERLAKARATTGLPDAVLCGVGRVDGHEVSLAVMDFRFMGGSLGAAVGELITRAAETAVRRRVPLLVVTASGGARMQEGVIALMQMAKVSQAIAGVRDAGLLTVSLVTDPTYGGVAASFATNCDVVVVEHGARMGFAGPRVIEQTIGEKLPEDFQTASFLLAHGQVDAVLQRREIPGWLGALFAATSGPGWEDVEGPRGVAPAAGTKTSRDPWDVVAAARDTARPTALDHITTALDGFVELHGDRLAADCPAIVAGFATLDGRPLAVVGHQKGHDTAELVARNFGMPRPEGYRKALRVMELAARLHVPILTIVDTPGAFPGKDAEEHGQSFAIARNILRMFELDTPIVTVVTGEGGSGGALALAVADRVLMCENSVYSVISPEGCSSILWGDAKSAPEAARALRITSHGLHELGLVDGVLPEPADIRTAVARALAELSGEHDLIGARRARFRACGAAGLLIAEG
jgi:acyl-CoA carboxylase subunit beta